MSDIVYTPPFVPNTSQVPPYKPAAPDLISYLSIYGRRIVVQNAAIDGGGANPLYTVPVGKQFYLFMATISATSANALAAGTLVWPLIRVVGPTGMAGSDVIVTCLMGYGANNSASATFPAPLRMLENETLEIEVWQFGGVPSNTQGVACIFGYEIDSSILNSIL